MTKFTLNWYIIIKEMQNSIFKYKIILKNR